MRIYFLVIAFGCVAECTVCAILREKKHKKKKLDETDLILLYYDRNKLNALCHCTFLVIMKYFGYSASAQS